MMSLPTLNKIRVSIRIILPFLLFCIFLRGQAQDLTDANSDPQSKSKRAAIGFNLNQFQNDFGLGINLTSPYFLHGQLALRASANFQWLQNQPPPNFESTWSPYQTYKFGVTTIGWYIGKSIRIYSEGGGVIIRPNKEFSGKTTQSGGYGLFGFEFYANKSFCYFVELGGIGTGAIAEKSLSKPIYSNGFLSSVGFRVRL